MKICLQVFFYLNAILNEAGVPKDMQNYASVGVGSVNTFMTIVSVSNAL